MKNEGNICTHLRSPSELRRLTSSCFFQNEFLGFLDALCDCVQDTHRKSSLEMFEVPKVSVLHRLLECIRSLAGEVRLECAADHRFGNPAFRSFVTLLRNRVGKILGDIVDHTREHDKRGCIEILAWYLTRSFGSEERIDYGTGHELNFFAFMFCLHRVGFIQPNHFPAIVLTVFWEYFELARYVIRRYALEPAGSRGCWGLDDHQFLPFLFGASQLSGTLHLTPEECTTPSIAFKHEAQLLFCNTVVAVNELKTGDFREHSAYLNFIRTQVDSWSKVRIGLRNMYENEILNKFVVMKHFPLSRYIPRQ